MIYNRSPQEEREKNIGTGGGFMSANVFLKTQNVSERAPNEIRCGKCFGWNGIWFDEIEVDFIELKLFDDIECHWIKLDEINAKKNTQNWKTGWQKIYYMIKP